jgi:myo-inositol-1(or 4)-monophosphatase
MQTRRPIVEVMWRIQEALQAAVCAVSPFADDKMRVDFKQWNDPVTEADGAVNKALWEILVRDGEGWLSEESVDDLTRLKKSRVWVVDPIDGTREFVEGIPEWCVSIGLVENGEVIAGGICNPATNETFIGGVGYGLIYNGQAACVSRRKTLRGAAVLASRSEVNRGEWDCFRNGPLAIRPMGSVAYKLALVAAGVADATWTLTPKHEWNVAGGVALVKAAGGFADELDSSFVAFNRRHCLLPNLLASGPFLAKQIGAYIRRQGYGAGGGASPEDRRST